MTLRLRESERFRLFATQFRDLVLCRFAFCVLDDLRGCFAREVARPHTFRESVSDTVQCTISLLSFQDSG